MRISKEKARDAAEKIVAPLTQKIEDYKEQMGAEVLAEYEKHIPVEVKKCFSKHPAFFKTETSVWVGNLYGQSLYAVFGKAVPKVADFKMSKDVCAGYVNVRETLVDNRDEAQRRIENTILALGTLKRIAAEFPEALPFIDVPQPNTALMINVAPVRQLACDLIPGCGDKK